jgi:hypothetical protein
MPCRVASVTTEFIQWFPKESSCALTRPNGDPQAPIEACPVGDGQSFHSDDVWADLLLQFYHIPVLCASETERHYLKDSR